MSYQKQSFRILFPLFAAAILCTTFFWQAAQAENSDAQAPQYAVKYDNWKADQFAASISYSDDLALQYANQNAQSILDASETNDNDEMARYYENLYGRVELDAPEVEYSNDLGLMYASRFEPSLLDEVDIEYSNDLALSYASQYGDLTSESFPVHNRTIRLDVAEAGTRFVFDEAPVFDDGMPAYGNSFVTEGYLYPAGTLSESNGVLPNGDPEFPDLVLGRWACRGWFVGDGAHTESGPWVLTTQVYDFGEEVGAKSIITEGFELSDIGVAGQRAITGGTGSYGRARGTMTQTLIGFNETMGVNLQVTINPSR